MKKIQKHFIKESIKANQELKYYIQEKLSKKDFKDQNKIGFGGDITKRIDTIAENIFVKYLIKFCNIVSEESGIILSKNPILNNGKIILDPLDGSDNFLSDLPYYGSSVSLKIDNLTVAGIVYNLVTNRYIYRTNYKNNFNQKKYYKSNFGIFERAYTVPNITQKLYEKNIKFRSPGASALSLAWVNNYSFFLLAGKIREFDVDAGLFICQDLYSYQNEDFLLVSKHKDLFHTIKEIIKDY